MTARHIAHCESQEAARAAAAFVEQAVLLISKERRFDRALDNLLDALRELEEERNGRGPIQQ